MGFNTEILGLSGGADKLLRDLIHERAGLFFDNGKGDLLKDKLSPLVIERGFTSLLDYYYLLKYDETAHDEWLNVMNALSVPETYFWREIDQVRTLVDLVVPQWFATRGHEPLKIWSAACATGEEPLTIAMALNEAGWLARAPIEIYASDASTAAIEKARRGSTANARSATCRPNCAPNTLSKRARHLCGVSTLNFMQASSGASPI